MTHQFSLKQPMQDVFTWWHKQPVYIERYKRQEEFLNSLFQLPVTELQDMIKTVAVLNQFYSTNIQDVIKVAEMLYEKREYIESEIINKECNFALVNDIAGSTKERTKIGKKGGIRSYSFTTKYFSFLSRVAFKKDIYPIYDSNVKKMLLFFRDKHCKFSEFTITEIEKDYEAFYNVMMAFCQTYGLDDVALKDVDKFLWVSGKEKWKLEFDGESIRAIKPPEKRAK